MREALLGGNSVPQILRLLEEEETVTAFRSVREGQRGTDMEAASAERFLPLYARHLPGRSVTKAAVEAGVVAPQIKPQPRSEAARAEQGREQTNACFSPIGLRRQKTSWRR